MIKNKKGYLLAETIIAISVVATVITIVYTITMNYFVKQDNEVTKYNSPQGLYNSAQIDKLFSNVTLNDDQTEKFLVDKLKKSNSDYIAIDASAKSVFNSLNISNVYFSKSNLSSLIRNEPIPNIIKRFLLNKNNEKAYVSCPYNYVVIYNDNSYTVIGTECDK